MFFVAHVPQSRYRHLVRLDALGLALFAVTGAEKALQAGATASVAIVMGVVTATFGGLLRDLLGGDRPGILSREVYASAAAAGAAAFVALTVLGATSGFDMATSPRRAAVRAYAKIPILLADADQFSPRLVRR